MSGLSSTWFLFKDRLRSQFALSLYVYVVYI